MPGGREGSEYLIIYLHRATSTPTYVHLSRTQSLNHQLFSLTSLSGTGNAVNIPSKAQAFIGQMYPGFFSFFRLPTNDRVGGGNSFILLCRLIPMVTTPVMLSTYLPTLILTHVCILPPFLFISLLTCVRPNGSMGIFPPFSFGRETSKCRSWLHLAFMIPLYR